MILPKTYIFFLLLISTYQQTSNSQLNNDMAKCMASATSQCTSVSLSSKDLECCQIFTDYYGNSYISDADFSMCMIFPKQKMTEEQIKSAQLIYHEAYGFSFTMVGSNIDPSEFAISFIQSYKCPSQQFSIKYEAGTYTNEEKEIFKKDNYCLRLYYQGLDELGLLGGAFNLGKKTITKSDCQNAELLPASKNIATCAYASFDFKLSDGSTKHLNTCLYISKSSFDTKTLDQHLESSFDSYNSFGGMTITSYEVEITDKNGKGLKYDSKLKTLTSSNNKGELIRISSLIAIIIMIYLL